MKTLQTILINVSVNPYTVNLLGKQERNVRINQIYKITRKLTKMVNIKLIKKENKNVGKADKNEKFYLIK